MCSCIKTVTSQIQKHRHYKHRLLYKNKELIEADPAVFPCAEPLLILKPMRTSGSSSSQLSSLRETAVD